MLSRALRRTSKLFYNCSQQSQEVWSDTELLYNPKTPLNFQNGRCKLYMNEQFGQARLGFWILFGAGTGIAYYSAKKIYNYQERKWYGILFYLSLIGVIASQSVGVSRQFRKLIVSLDLLPCGRQVLLVHPNAFGLKTEFKCDISKISRPKDINEYIYQMQLVFPVVFNSRLFFLQRDPDYIVNKEVLPAVMNAKYIKVD